jgi:AbrB family looped-hinge helix DNA binding protein
MSKVTAKLQITLPKALADRFSIHPGDEIEWRATRDAIHILPPTSQARQLDVEERLELFDQATRRQRAREAKRVVAGRRAADRGWSRDELYDRPRAR